MGFVVILIPLISSHVLDLTLFANSNYNVAFLQMFQMLLPN